MKRFNENVLSSKEKVLVKFGAPWCSPCKTLDPIIEELTEEGLNIYTVNTDEDPDYAIKYQVRNVPTTIMFVDGKEVSRKTGIVSKSTLKSIYQGVNQ